MKQEVRIWLCGELRVEVGGRRVERALSRRKSRQLLALLAVSPSGMSRECVIEALWPDEPQGRRGGALRQLLCELRRCLGPRVVAGRSFIQLALPAGAFVDVNAAEEAVDRCWQAIAAGSFAEARGLARSAAALTSPEFLPGEMGAWMERRRMEIEDLGLSALEALTRAYLAEPGFERAAERAARQLVWRAPFRERAHALLMEALLESGNPGEALRGFERLRVLLREELGTSPSPPLRALHSRALDAAGCGAPSVSGLRSRG